MLNLDNLLKIYLPITLAVIVLIIILVLVLKNKKKTKKPILDSKVLNEIYVALGEVNILSVTREQDRVKVVLKDPKQVDANKLRELSIPASLKGKEVTLLYRNFSGELEQYIKESLGK